METNPASDVTLVRLELLSRHVRSLAEELERVDDEIGEVMFDLSGVRELDGQEVFTAWSATIERIDGLIEAGETR